MVKPDTEKPAELNIEKSNTENQLLMDQVPDSIPFRKQRRKTAGTERKRCDVCHRDRKLSGIDFGEYRV